MKPCAATVVPQVDKNLFRNIEKVVEVMPDIDLGTRENGEPIVVSCHHVAHALAKVFPVEVRDGYFGNKGWRHSWLVTRNEMIIDSYPWAMIGGPFLVDTRFFSPWPKLYIENNLSGLDDKKFLKEVEIVAGVIRETVVNLKIEAF